MKVLDKHALRKQKYIRANNSNYITKALRKEIMHRSRLHNKFFIIIFVMSYVRERAFLQHTANSSFSVLCSKNFEVTKLAATRYDETNVHIHSFLILNVEKPKFLNGIFFGDNNKFVQTILIP